MEYFLRVITYKDTVNQYPLVSVYTEWKDWPY